MRFLRVGADVLGGVVSMMGLGLAGLVLSATWTLSVERDEGASTCPDGPRLRRAIAERLGKDPFVDTAPPETVDVREDELSNPFGPPGQPRPSSAGHQELSVRFRRAPTGHAAVVALKDRAGAERGRRELSSVATECTELAGAVVLASALVIDPLVLTRPAPSVDAGVLPSLTRPPDAMRPPPVVPQPVAPELPPLATAPQPLQPWPPPSSFRPATPPPPPALNSLFVGAGAGLAILRVAPLAAYTELFGTWTSRSLIAGVRLGLTSPGAFEAGVGTLRAMLFEATALLCVRWGVAGLCTQAGVGTFQAWSEGLPNPRPQGALHGSFGAGGVLDFALGERLRLRSFGTALLQPPMTLAVGGRPVATVPAYGFLVTLSLHVRLLGDVIP